MPSSNESSAGHSGPTASGSAELKDALASTPPWVTPRAGVWSQGHALGADYETPFGRRLPSPVHLSLALSSNL
jgi:hypothetical protein